MRRLTLVEYQTCEAVLLSRQEVDALQRVAPSVGITPAAGRRARYDLTPGSWVGAINLGTLAIEIRPKLPIDQVFFLLAYVLDPRSWQETPFHFDQAPSLLAAVIPAFAGHVRRAIRRGLLQSYRTEEAALPAVRGRLRFDAQVRERFGLFPPAEVRYDEFTADVEENRLIKAAIARLSRLRLPPGVVTISLRRLAPAFDGVRLLPYNAVHLPAIRYTQQNAHYRPAVELARLVLRSCAFELRHGEVEAAAFLVDMNQVFEEFVVVALREALGLSEHVFPQGAAGKPLLLDLHGAVQLRPDLSWWDGTSCTFVGDVKYKRTSAAGVEHPDLYQLLAYTIATGLPGGLLVYAGGEAEPVSHRVVRAGKELQITALDLAGSPAEILGQIATVAQRVRRLRRRARAGTAA
ncbi:MAG: McrC family protein [Chloroflexota bacterium]